MCVPASIVATSVSRIADCARNRASSVGAKRIESIQLHKVALGQTRKTDIRYRTHAAFTVPRNRGGKITILHEEI